MRNLNNCFLMCLFAGALAAFVGGCGAESTGSDGTANEQSATSESETATQSEETTSDSSDEATTDSTDGTDTETGDETTADETDVDPMAELVNGWYVFRLKVTSESELPIVGPTQSSIFNYGVAQVRSEGNGYVLEERHCRYVMSTSELFTASISDDVPASIGLVTAPISFNSDSSTISWERDETVIVVGADLADPKSDELPTDAEDERIIDQDNDGNPGVTASIEGLITAEVYFVQRQRMAYSGVRAENGDLMGDIQDASEQNIVDATNPMLLNSGDAVPVPEESNILFVAVERELSCDQLNESIETYFAE